MSEGEIKPDEEAETFPEEDEPQIRMPERRNPRIRNQECEKKNPRPEFDKCTVLSAQQLTMCSQEEFEKHKYVKYRNTIQ